MRPLPTFVLSLLPAASLASQHPAPAGWSEPVPTPGSCSLYEEDGTLWGIGADYKVRFAADRIELTPALGRLAPRNLPVSYRVTHVGRAPADAAAPLWTAVSPPARSHAGTSVRYARREVLERYDLRPDGVELSFVFDALPPGRGDLVVRGVLTTELAPAIEAASPAGGGWCADGVDLVHHLPDGTLLGGVRIGAVTGIDAAGRRASGTLRCAHGVLELRLPAELVEGAALPLVLDPLVGPLIGVASGYDEEQPDVAWTTHTGGRTHLVVWPRRFSASDVDIRGQQLAGDGTPVGSLIGIRSSTTLLSDQPCVAALSSRDAFVVAWRERPSTGLATYIAARAVPAAGGLPGNVLQVVAAGNERFLRPDLGGDRDDLGDEVIAVWENLTQGRVEGCRLKVSSSGVLSALGRTFLSSAPERGRPAIAQDGGEEGRFLVVWQVQGSTRTTLESVVVDRLLAVRDRPVVTTVSGPSLSRPDVDGDGRHWLVVYERRLQAASQPDVACCWVTWEARTDTAYVAREVIVQNGGIAEQTPRVCLLGTEALVAFSEEIAPGGHALAVRSLDHFSCVSCEGREVLDAVVTIDSRRVALCDSDAHGALLVWERRAGSASGGLVAQRFTPLAIGAAIPDSACGAEDARAYATCAIHGHVRFTLRLEHAEPNVPVFLIIGPYALQQIGQMRCGPCSFIDPLRGFAFGLGATDAFGNAAVNLPLPPTGTLSSGFQFAWLPSSAPGCPTLGLSFSRQAGVFLD